MIQACDQTGTDKAYIQNFDGKISCKRCIWKTEKEMGVNIKKYHTDICCEQSRPLASFIISGEGFYQNFSYFYHDNLAHILDFN